jgi:hypothetical protein
MTSPARTTRSATEIAAMRVRVAYIYGGSSQFAQYYRNGSNETLAWIEGRGGIAPASQEWRASDPETEEGASGLRRELRYALSEDERLAGSDAAAWYNAIAVTLKWFAFGGRAPA